MKAQRLRITFSRGDDLKYLSHLDMMRFWERALRRARLPVAYSEGFTPHVQIQIAAPLPVGTTTEADIMDVFLEERLTPRAFLERARAALPPAMRIIAVEEVGLALPSLQAETRHAEYEVDVPVADLQVANESARRFLAAESIPWEHRREDQTRSYDIRALVRDIAVGPGPTPGVARLRMTLRNDPSGSGRPDQVVAALGLPPPSRVHRTRILLANTSRALEAWRRHGRFSEG